METLAMKGGNTDNISKSSSLPRYSTSSISTTGKLLLVTNMGPYMRGSEIFRQTRNILITNHAYFYLPNFTGDEVSKLQQRLSLLR